VSGWVRKRGYRPVTYRKPQKLAQNARVWGQPFMN